MNAAVMIQSCPGEEVLAAFIDQRLDPASRLEVVKHLAECGDCRDMVVAANEYENAEVAAGGEVVRGPFRRRPWVPLAAAAALAGVVVFGVPSIRERILFGNPMEELVEAANGVGTRPFYARLSGDFAHKTPRIPRGNEEVAELTLELAAMEAEGRAHDRPTATNLHAAGVGQILTKKRVEAVTALEGAANASPKSAAILTDLAAAYLARGQDADYQRALVAATKGWGIEQTPAAAWNRALALELLGRDHEAIAAWQEYLALDENSTWAIEARDRLQRLQDPNLP